MARKAAKPTNQNKEFFEAINMLEQERGIPADYLLEKVCAAIITSVRREYGGEDVVFVDCNPEKCEFYIPTAVSLLLEEEKADVKVLDTNAQWHGVTYKEDKSDVVAAFKQLISEGIYSENF